MSVAIVAGLTAAVAVGVNAVSSEATGDGERYASSKDSMAAVQTETSNRLGLGDLSYGGPLTFSTALSGQLSVAPTTSIPTPTFSVDGTLPGGVTFDAATGRFTGPDAWNFEAAQISGGWTHTCAVLTDGTARCWGDNWIGQLGDGTTTNRSNPVQVLASGTAESSPVALTDVESITAGYEHTCAVLTDGTARCWGSNSRNQLGDGTTTNRTNPVQVLASGTAASSPVALTGVESIGAGGDHTCALLTDGTARCWGRNSSGYLGDGTTTNRTNPVQVLASGTAAASPVALTGIESIDVGYYHTCAVLADGTARCWGANYLGRLGDGTETNRTNPVQVLASGTAASSPVALTGIVSITSFYHVCALLTDGTARCWGENSDGELGDGTTTHRYNPVQVLASGTAAASPVALTGIESIAAGGEHTCVVLPGGTPRCWGDNWAGQLGDGTTTSRVNPAAVSGIAGNPGWPATVTVSATDGTSTATAQVTLQKQ